MGVLLESTNIHDVRCSHIIQRNANVRNIISIEKLNLIHFQYKLLALGDVTSGLLLWQHGTLHSVHIPLGVTRLFGIGKSCLELCKVQSVANACCVMGRDLCKSGSGTNCMFCLLLIRTSMCYARASLNKSECLIPIGDSEGLQTGGMGTLVTFILQRNAITVFFGKHEERVVKMV